MAVHNHFWVILKAHQTVTDPGKAVAITDSVICPDCMEIKTVKETGED